MIYINNNILCLTYNEFVPAIMVADTYNKNRSRGNITVHGRGGNGSKVLIEYESLPTKYKDKVKELFGNPYDYMAKQPILDLIDWDYKAFTFYSDYILPNGSKLPASDCDAMGKEQINYVDRYTKCVNWLNMLSKFTTDKRALKQALNISVMEFWDVVSELILKQHIALPTNPKRLKEKLKEFNSYADPLDRFEMLIEKHRFGNSNAKARDEESDALILKLLADPRKHDDTVIAAAYNKYAKEHGKKTLTAGAIAYIRKQNEHIIASTRDGDKRAYNKFSKEIGRDRASSPLLLLNADDNTLDLFFTASYRNASGKLVKNAYYRPNLYVIIDTYNDYILGYSYGDNITHEVIYDAFRNALNHIQELTGAYYLGHQLQTDRWGLDVKMKNELADFYTKVGGKFTPQAHRVPQGKYIERSFGTEWHQVLKVLPTKNYSGHNIKAKEALSQEFIAQNAKNHPSIEQMPQIIEGFINIMRNKPNPKTGISRQVEWLEAFMQSEKSRKNHIDTATKLSIIGKKHPNLLTITTKGVQGMIAGQKLRFDLPDEVIWKYNGAKVEVLYDPERLDEVLITDGKGLRFVASEYNPMPAALADFEEGDGKRLHTAFENKRQISMKLTSILQEKLKALDGSNINPESLLQAGVMIKDLKNNAEAEYLQQLYEGKKALPTTEKVKVTASGYEDDSRDDVRDLY
ncbi:transposase family protein [Sphingobacterium cavernae]|uniref:transposase family protein n=1 Tax=Sphingobacterium cavernae TaxID=2592657 RepID=UPI001230041F|nr:transposase family protein [Sphingobacterium cavernae]